MGRSQTRQFLFLFLFQLTEQLQWQQAALDKLLSVEQVIIRASAQRFESWEALGPLN